MKPKIPAILFTSLLLLAAIFLVVWPDSSSVSAGDETWSELAICPIDVADKSVRPGEFARLVEDLQSSLTSENVAARVAEQFSSVLPKRTCLEQIGTLKIKSESNESNRVVITMATDNPLVGAAILEELLLRANRDFLSQTSRLGTEQADLINLQNKQVEFQTRIVATQQELNKLVTSSSQDSTARMKIDSMRAELGQLEEMDRVMREQLKNLEAMGEGMTFESPTLEVHVTQAPTFDRVSFHQLNDYCTLQKDNRSFLSPLTPAMQNALEGKTGFTVQ